MKRYEGMFLFDTGAARDWASMEAEVRRLLDRISATLLVLVKFDERKLAFEINGRKRGTYLLAYFDAPPDRITALERDVTLSELLLRSMFLRSEISAEKLAALQAHPAEQPLSPHSGDRRHDDDEPRGDRDRDRGDRGHGRDRRDRRDEPAPEEIEAGVADL